MRGDRYSERPVGRGRPRHCDAQERGVGDLIAFCRERIAAYKCPRSVDIRDGMLPLSGAGKILKRELRAPFWEGKARRVN